MSKQRQSHRTQGWIGCGWSRRRTEKWLQVSKCRQTTTLILNLVREAVRPLSQKYKRKDRWRKRKQKIRSYSGHLETEMHNPEKETWNLMQGKVRGWYLGVEVIVQIMVKVAEEKQPPNHPFSCQISLPHYAPPVLRVELQ